MGARASSFPLTHVTMSPPIRAVLCAAIAVGVAAIVLALQNVAVAAFFPHLQRVPTDFSPAYLDRELRSIRAAPAPTVFLGDSVLWGYRIAPDQTAIELLRDDGCDCRNLAFKAGSPPNYYVLARLLETYRVHPAVVVMEVNQKVLNSADDAYKKIHPGLAGLGERIITPADRRTLTVPPSAPGPLDALWLPYAMRSDIRDLIAGDPPPPVQKQTADLYLGTYDLSPLSPSNVGVRYLDETLHVLRRAGVRVLAFTTPTNHPLLHEYIDVPEYRANDAYLIALLKRDGARVLDLDAAFPGREFLDETHLPVEGNRRLAQILARALNEPRRAAAQNAL